jgi:dephospho-CoA kinase
MIVVGLTGNVAAGKSTVRRLWSAAGVPVLDADQLAREAVAPGSAGLREVIDAFGPELRTAEGALDRGAMRARVFADPEARRRLEAILHPRISTLRDAWVQAQRRSGVPLAVVEIPLLFEAGQEGSVDRVVVVDAPESIRLRRLVDERGIPAAEGARIIAAQLDPAMKRERAHFVIDNAGSEAELAAAAAEVLHRLRREAGGEGPA